MRISDFVLDSRAGPLDRTLGFAFGAARGLILVVIAVLFLNFFIAPDRQPEWIAASKTKPWLDSIGSDLMNRLPDDPEAEIMERLRGEEPAGAPPAGDDPVQEPAPSGGQDAPPAGAEPDYAPDDQNQLERQLEAPPPD
jgi:membrane protein required for colicin V production